MVFELGLVEFGLFDPPFAFASLFYSVILLWLFAFSFLGFFGTGSDLVSL